MFNLYMATYFSDQTKFIAHLRLSAAKDRNEQTLKQPFRENTVTRIDLPKITQGAKRTRKGQFHDHAWCQQIASIQNSSSQEIQQTWVHSLDF